MSNRYLSNIALALIAGFEVVASQAFAPAVFAWLALAGGAAIVAMLFIAAATEGRGVMQRALDGVGVVLGALLIVLSLVFAAATFTWIGFGLSVGLVGVAVAGLTLHELKTERVVHAIELHEQPMRDREAIAA